MAFKLPLSLTRVIPMLRPQIRFLTTSNAYFSDELPLTFASPYQSFYNCKNIQQVDVSTISGDMGILPNHVPVIAALKPGLVSVYEEDGTVKKFFVSSGIVTVNEDSSIQILAEEASPLDNLDRAEAERGLEQCQRDLTSATTEETKTEASIGIEFHEAALKEL